MRPCLQNVLQQIGEASPGGYTYMKAAKRQAGLNEREALGKVVTARPPKRSAQPRSV